jgi:hypothetical protein
LASDLPTDFHFTGDTKVAGLYRYDASGTSFCKNLHAKCYLNEELCIITSLNLYEFSQVNNNEMGVLIRRADDPALYKEAYEEAQRIIRISDEVRISLERVKSETPEAVPVGPAEGTSDSDGDTGAGTDKLTSSRLAQRHGMKTADLLDKLTSAGYLALEDGKHRLTQKGAEAGGEFIAKSRFGPYFLWPQTLKP